MNIFSRVPLLFTGPKKIDELKREVGEVHHALSILTAGLQAEENLAKHYTGNRYKSYRSQVEALSQKFEGKADWGNPQVRNIVKVRAAFTLGQGIKLYNKQPEKNAEREIEFIEAFLKYNDLDKEVAQAFAQEAEIEGKFLCRLFPNLEDTQVEVRFIPWVVHRYEVICKAEDYLVYERVEYKLNSVDRDIKLEPWEFVYKKFGGRMHKVNDTPPKLGTILGMVEGIDKAIWDWREQNHLFGKSTPYFKTETAGEAAELYTRLKALNWKIGMFLTGQAEFSFVGMSVDTILGLEKEILMKMKILSGDTGVPIHFLGLPELMSNRAVSTDLFELIFASTSDEHQTWIGCYEEMFQKALAIANERLNGGFDTGVVGCKIPLISAAKMQEIKEVWLPIWTDGGISLDTFLGKLPDVDVEEEKGRLEAAQDESMVKTLAGIKAKEEEGDRETEEVPA